MATYPVPRRTARWARLALRVALILAVALSDIVLLASPQGTQASRPEQAGVYQVTLKVGSGLVYSLPQGASVTLPISVSVAAAVGLASASVLVQYNPLQLRPTACVPRQGGPGGFCNIAYDTTNGLIRFNVLSDTGLLGSDIGLFDLTFAAASTSTVRTEVPITPLIESITDLQGTYMTSWAQGSKVKIAAASGGGAAVYVGAPNGPNPLSITRGLTTAVPIVITGVTGLGSASFSLAFDPAVVRPLECRSVQRPDADGVCTLHADHVAANLLAQSGVPGSVSESVTAFEVVFTTAPTALVNAQSPLNLTLGAFADTAGAPITVRLINNALKVSKTAGAAVPVLRLAPTAQYLTDDARVPVHIFLDNGGELAAGSWGIRYDPLVVQAESCGVDTNVANAFCNPAAEPGLVRMTVLSLTEGGLPADLPANIGSITFRRHPQAKAGQKSSLTFEVTNFADDLNQQLPYQTQAAEITLAQELGNPAAVAIRLIGTPPYLLYRGSSLDFPVNFTTNAPLRPIAHLTGSIHYNPIVLRPTQCVLSSPTLDGLTAFCNAQYDTEQGIIRFTLFSTEGFSGSVTPFVLTFEAASTAVTGNNSPLHFTVEAIGGPQGEPRTWAATDETVLIKDPVTAPRVLVSSPELPQPVIYHIALGTTTTVPLWVENVPDLGAGTIEVRYDPKVAHATRCTLRSDLTPTLDGGFCSLLPGVVRFAFVASEGITGTTQLYDIEFAQAPNVVGGEATPLTVVVLNFVDTHEVPIPTTIGSGIINIPTIRITKTADPTHVLKTGDDVKFTFLVENTGLVGVTLNSLVDTKFGNLAGKGTCTIPQTIPIGGSYACEYTVFLASESLTPHYNVVTASAASNAGITTADDDDETVTFDDLMPTGIGDRVWLDENGNGLQDAGEDGIANVKMTVAKDAETYTTYTDANGSYVFTDLDPGNWTVTVDPASLAAGLAANPTYDENGVGTPHTTTVVLATGEEHLTAGFGYNWAPASDVTGNTGTGAIGDRVWADVNSNGVQDPGEAGLGGVSVELVTAGPDGLFGTGDDDIAFTTTTNANGNYVFDDLAAGAYVVRLPTPPAGYTQRGEPDGTLDSQTTQPIVLAPGDVFVAADFGYAPQDGLPNSIGDTVWLDVDRDGVQDAGEPGIRGVTVALIRDLNGDGAWDAGEPIIATDSTDVNGQYSFSGLPTADGVGTDDYLVWVNDTANVLAPLVPTYDVRDGANQGNPTTGVVTGLTISAVSDLTATPVTDADFAFAPFGHDAGEGLIGDTIYLDRDGSNDYDAGEGLEGVRVRLYAANGTTLLATTTTNENGQYFFGGLSPTGTYVVKVDSATLPTGLTNTVGPDGGATHQSTVILTTGAPISLNQDFGYRDTSSPNTIAGTIWQDTDADGLLDGGESGRWAGVTAALLDANDSIVATTATDANGAYSFGNLPDGTFKVDVTDDANVLNGTWNSTGPTPGADNNSQAEPYTVTVGPGNRINSTADFGYYNAPAGLGNFVWDDANKNGIQDTGESGLGGVMVTLTITWPSGGGSSTVKTTADASGYYSFGNLLLDENLDGVGAGEPTFTIAVATPATYAPTLANQGSSDALDSDPSGVTATTTEGTVNTIYDFGFVKQVPDITPVITAIPNIMSGPTQFNVTVRVTELEQVDTSGLITVRIPVDVRWTLDGPYGPTLTVLGSTPVNNSVWTYSLEDNRHVFRTTATITAGGFSTFGFKAVWNGGPAQGVYTITSQIGSWSGGENRIDNNSDAEKLDYFIN